MASFQGGDDDIQVLDILAGSSFQFQGYIDLIAKLPRARAKFSKVAYRSRPSFFAPSNLFVKDTHGPGRFVGNTFAQTKTLDVEASSSQKYSVMTDADAPAS